MNKLLKADIYKLLKNKSLYICSLICLAFAPISILILNFAKNLSQNTELGQEMAEAGVSALTIDFSSNIGSAFTGNTPIFVAIILSLFIASEFSLGTIKNTASKAYSRTKIYLSKWITMVVFSNILMILFALIYGILAYALWGYGTPGEGFMIELLKMTGLQILLNTALTSVFTMLAILIRQGGGAIAVNICLITFAAQLVSLGEYILQNITGNVINLSQYLLTTTTNEVAGMNLTSDLITRSLIMSVVYIAASLFIGIYSFNKRDIK